MQNGIRTGFLFATLTGLFMAIGFVVGGVGGMVLALGFSIATNMFAYWNSDRIVLKLQNAEPLARQRAPEIFDLVAELSRRAGLPMPRVYLIHTEQPNAFATGRNPDNAAVALSMGLIQHLDQRELAGVIAHELAHIRSRDTLTMALTGTMAGAISMLAQFGLFFGGRNSNNPLGPIGAIAMVILAPMAAMIVQMAISRTREYEADRIGAEISDDPLGLASALEKISGYSRQVGNPLAQRSPGMAHMFIINPLAGRGTDNLFATHPDVGNRIAALMEMEREKRLADEPTRDNTTLAPHWRDDYDRRGEPGWRVPSTGPRKQKAPSRGPWG